MKKAIAVALIGLSLASVEARANTINVTTDHFREGAGYDGDSFVLFDPGFDNSLGTLAGVTVTIDGTLLINYPLPSVPSGLLGTYSFPATIETYAFLSSSYGVLGSTSTPAVQLPNTIESSLGHADPVLVSFTQPPPVPLFDYANGVGNDPSFVAYNKQNYPDLLGTLLCNTNLVATFLYFHPVGFTNYYGPLQDDVSMTFNGTVTENFTYTVAEPASAALVGFGLFASALASSRRTNAARRCPT